jgi:hypothetical protein
MKEHEGRMIGTPLPPWMREGPGLYPDTVQYLCQLTDDEELFERLTEDGLGVNGYIIYDKKKRLQRHLEPEDALYTALRAFHRGAAVLRVSPFEGGFFFSEGTSELRFIKGGQARSVYFYDGLDGGGHRRTIRIAAFFLTADRVLLVDQERGCLQSLDRAAALRALSGAEAGRGWMPIDVNDPALDHQPFPYGPPAGEHAVVLSSFREDKVYFAIASSSRHIQYLRVHAFDPKSETIRDHEWPLIQHTDLAFLYDLYERRRAAFYAYLDALPAVWKT